MITLAEVPEIINRLRQYVETVVVDIRFDFCTDINEFAISAFDHRATDDDEGFSVCLVPLHMNKDDVVVYLLNTMDKFEEAEKERERVDELASLTPDDIEADSEA